MTPKLFLLDMDGTLYLGDKLFSCTRPFLDYLKENGIGYLFLTNNSAKNTHDYVKKLKRLGIESCERDFLTSADAAAVYLKEKCLQKEIYVMGTKSLISGLDKVGLNVTDTLSDSTEVLICGYDTELTYKKLWDASVLLTRGAEFYATNCDLVCPTEFGFVPDCGSVCEMLYNATGKRPCFIGKPKPLMIELAAARCGVGVSETAVVGDRIYTDIKSGINAGAHTVLVMSGETTEDILRRSPDKPETVVRDVGELTRLLREGRL